MFNVLLDKLPEEFEGFRIFSDFRTGIQISQCMDDPDLSQTEKIQVAAELLFGSEPPFPDVETCMRGISWFLGGWYTDNHTSGKNKKPVMDYDRDQWRIYGAFLSQYRIDLNTQNLHYWTFMALLSTLDSCSFTNVMDIRSKKIDGGMSKESKRALIEAKKRYGLESAEERETEFERMEREAIAADFLSKLQKK